MMVSGSYEPPSSSNILATNNERTNESKNYKTPGWTTRYVPVNKSSPYPSHNFLNYLHPSIRLKLKKLNIESLFPIQEAVIPFLIHNGDDAISPYSSDICVSAETGQGKTFCYVLPIVHCLMDRITRYIRCIVLLPTRELALQVFSCFEIFGKFSYIDNSRFDLKVCCLIGQNSFSSERDLLKFPPDIVVCTPGRLLEHYTYESYTNNNIDKILSESLFFNLKWFVVDEADKLLSQEFHDWYYVLQDISSREWADRSLIKSLGNTFQPKRIQKILLSATMTKNPQKIAKLKMVRPIYFISCSSGSYATPENLQHYFATTTDSLKPLTLIQILDKIASTKESYELKETVSSPNHFKIIVFCQTRENAHRLTRLIQLHQHSPFNSDLSGEKVQASFKPESVSPSLSSTLKVFEFSAKFSQPLRNRLLDEFRCGKINCLIVSDIAARGLDISDVNYVINYDTPFHTRSYIHRAGRTARAGRSGITLSLLKLNQLRYFRKTIKKSGILQENLHKWNTVSPDPDFLNRYKESLKLLDLCLHQEHSGQLISHVPLNPSKINNLKLELATRTHTDQVSDN